MFRQVILEQAPVRSATCSDSTKESGACTKACLQEKDLHTAVLLHSKEATGYGLLYLTHELLKLNGIDCR